MSGGTDFGFGEIEASLKQTAARMLAERQPAPRLHALVAAEPGPSRGAWDVSLWDDMVDAGWPGIAVPGRAGGLGLPVVSAVALLEEIGRAAAPSPLPSTMAAAFVLDACGTAEADVVAARIADGTTATLALLDPDDSARNGCLHGRAEFVQGAGKATVAVVRADRGVYVVELDGEGVCVAPDAIVDLTRDQATVVFEGARAERVGDLDAWERALPRLLVSVAADMVGAAEWQLQTTAQYARTRVQFGHSLGFFQAVKHPIVDMMIAVDQARTLLYDAAHAIDTHADDALLVARMAKVAAGDAAGFCSGRSVQLHGGIGFTWECFVHLYFKRQQHSQMLYGDAVHHRARIADALLGPR